jgi:uncharacterized protein (DUF1015 family)
MAIVLPFRAIRPVDSKVQLVASRSVDGYQHEELHQRLEANPYSFLHVINPDFSDGQKTKSGSPERLMKVKKKFKSFVENGVFVQDTKPSYYIYRQINEGHEYLGIIACTSIDDYLNGVIKVHEQTITEREEKLKEYLDVCEFNAEPVLFCYPNDAVIDALIWEVTHTPSTNDFVIDGIRHSLWVLNDAQKLKTIALEFARIPAIYIADGHHRSASSALLGKERRKANPHHNGHEAYNYYLGVFFSESQLKIYDFNRIVKDLNGMSEEKLLEELAKKFDLRQVDELLHVPAKQHEFSMYLKGKCFVLEARQGTYLKGDPVTSLDASILTEHILAPLFNIHDLKTDQRVGFIPGIKGQEALKQAVDEGKAAVAFGLFPVTMDHLKWIADTHNIMPPKTTWVEPKMKSGMVIYNFEEE